MTSPDRLTEEEPRDRTTASPATTSDSGTAGSARALLAGQILRLAVTLLGVPVLARLLTPSDFGLAAPILALVGVALPLGDMGLSLAAIRAKTLSRSQWSWLFWINATLGLTVGALVVVGGIYVGGEALAGETTELLWLAALVFVFNGFAAQYRVQLVRSRNYVKLTIAEGGGQVLGLAAAVVIAVLSPGPLPLIAQPAIGSAFTAVGAAAFVRVGPGLPRRTRGLRELIVLGGVNQLGDLAISLADNAGAILLAGTVSPSVVGAFRQARNLSAIPHRTMGVPVKRLLVQQFGQAWQTDAFGLKLRKAIASYGYGAGLAAGLLGGLSVPIVSLVLGRDWVDLTPRLITIFCLGLVVSSAWRPISWALLAAGKARTFFLCEVPSSVVVIAALVAFGSRDAIAAAWVYTSGQIVVTVMFATIGARALGTGPGSTLRSGFWVMATCLVVLLGSAILVPISTGLGRVAQIAIGCVWAVIVLMVVSRLSGAARRDLQSARAIGFSVLGAGRLVRFVTRRPLRHPQGRVPR